MQYLKFENPGVAPSECFTMLGVSTSRYSTNKDVIGQFGSGSKHAINLLLRNNHVPFIFCGNLCLEFTTKDLTVNDGISANSFDRVVCKISGKNEEDRAVNRTEDLGWTLQNGELDWQDLSMACREFLSNSIDRCIRQTGNYKDVVVEVVEEKSVRAKKGHTRIFIPFTSEIAKFYYTLNKRFLHFANDNSVRGTLLEKAGRNLNNKNSPVIYRRGVYVREIASDLPSVFDYNFTDELRIDESRNAYDSTVKEAICKTLNKAKFTDKVKLLNSLLTGTFFEGNLNYYDLDCDAPYEEWLKAWQSVTSPIHVISSGGFDDLVRSKGYIPVTLTTNWNRFLERCGAKTDKQVLTDEEANGLEILPNTESVVATFNHVWEFMVNNKFSMGKDKPELKVFRRVANGPKTLGMYKNDTVYILDEIAGGESVNLKQTVLEEIVHHITGATDCSRELQEFTFRIITEKLL